ncbi:hypothetical protein [Fusibacter sp. JL216-2]|uniref:hypothetical protein n=1 Tax=Fusibacter sp. JL216-2 TaxID=3071453 RepID=UPI003D357A5E
MIVLEIDKKHSESIQTEWFKEKMKSLERHFKYSEIVQICAVDSREEFKSTIGIDFPEWVIAAALDSVVYLIEPRNWMNKHSIDQIVVHELVHVLVNKKPQNMPLALYEGIALYFADQVNSDFKNVAKLSIEEIENLTYEDEMFYEYAGYYVIDQINAIGLDEVISNITK